MGSDVSTLFGIAALSVEVTNPSSWQSPLAVTICPILIFGHLPIALFLSLVMVPTAAKAVALGVILLVAAFLLARQKPAQGPPQAAPPSA